jgi:hypothetical protein
MSACAKSQIAQPATKERVGPTTDPSAASGPEEAR